MGQLVNVLSILLKLDAGEDVSQVVDDARVVHLPIEITRVDTKHAREATGRVSVRQIQYTIRLGGVFTLGHLGPDIFYTVRLDVLEEEFVSHEDAIDIKEQRLGSHRCTVRHVSRLGRASR